MDNYHAYSTKELTIMTHIDRNKIGLLRRLGALHGIRKGNAYIYPGESIRQFLTDFSGHDISNELSIKKRLVQLGRDPQIKRDLRQQVQRNKNIHP